jgi:hypothetical protein
MFETPLGPPLEPGSAIATGRKMDFAKDLEDSGNNFGIWKTEIWMQRNPEALGGA